MSAFSKITQGLKSLGTVTQYGGVSTAFWTAGNILAEGSAPAAMALSAAGTPVAVGSALAVATTVLYAAFAFTAVTVCAVAPILLINYLSSNKSDALLADSTDVELSGMVDGSDKAEVGCDKEVVSSFEFSEMDLPTFTVEAAGLDSVATVAAA